MKYADIHIHLLPGVDDGARTMRDTQRMIEQAYASGTRIICCTSHYHPGYFGDNKEKVREAFRITEEYVSKKFPDLRLFLGNELRFSPECLDWLSRGDCNTINHTNYVLIDFSEMEQEKTITTTLNQLLNAGWNPVLAHAERYRTLHGKLSILQRYIENGVVLQADTQSLFRGFGFRIQRQCIKLLANRMIDVISSDAHDCDSRPPEMDQCYYFLKKKYGEHYADVLCYQNACTILKGDPIERI